MNIKKLLFDALGNLFLGEISDIYQEIMDTPHNLLTKKYIKEILKFSSKKNDYYRQFLARKLSLDTLPILTKKIIRNNFNSLQSSEKGPRVFRNSSGGSTGIPLLLLQDRLYNKWSRTTEKFYFNNFLDVEWNAVKNVVLWGSERDTFKQNNLTGKIYNFLSNTTFLNTFNVGADQWREFVEIINNQKPYYIKGYAGSLYQIARYIKANNLKIHKPKFIYSSAEMLRDFMRREIEDVFRAKVYDFYGSREVGAIAGECRRGRRHIFTFNNFVEIFELKTDHPCKGEKTGRIIISNLHNFTMPLLRYEIGDMGSISYAKCSCGSKLPWFKKLTGRITDHFINKDGVLIHGEFFTHLFYYRDWVDEFRVTQLDYDLIEILIVKSKTPVNENNKKEIDLKIRKLMGDGCSVKWKFVGKIPLTPQGKSLFTRSLVAIGKR